MPALQSNSSWAFRAKLALDELLITKREYGGRIMTVEEARRLLQTDAVAQHVLSLPLMARLAYPWRDGSPRVVPMWFHWTGDELLMGAPPNSPTMKVIAVRQQVAVS